MKEHIKRSPNWTARPNGVNSVWGVVLHYTASGGDSGQAIANYFSTRASQVSAHDVIDEDGDVWHCVPVEKAAWHAGSCRRFDYDRDGRLEDWEQYANSVTIGFELCNTGRLSDNYPDAQIKTLARMIRRYNRKCPNLNYRNITDHQWLNLRGKVDVQSTFPAAKLFWYILHPYKAMPNNPYESLPKWARTQIDQIK